MKTKLTTTGQGSPVIEGVASLEATKAALATKLKDQKAADKLSAWERKTKKRNPAFVLGSTRKATNADATILGHTHGQVCEIRCSSKGCSTARVINKQDAFQVRFCAEHKKAASKAAGKVRRAAKAVAARTPEVIQAEIAALEAQLKTKAAAAS